MKKIAPGYILGPIAFLVCMMLGIMESCEPISGHPFDFPEELHQAAHDAEMRQFFRDWLKVESPEEIERGLTLTITVIDPNFRTLITTTAHLEAPRLYSPGSGFLIDDRGGTVFRNVRRLSFQGHWVDRIVKPADRIDLVEFAKMARER